MGQESRDVLSPNSPSTKPTHSIPTLTSGSGCRFQPPLASGKTTPSLVTGGQALSRLGHKRGCRALSVDGKEAYRPHDPSTHLHVEVHCTLSWTQGPRETSEQPGYYRLTSSEAIEDEPHLIMVYFRTHIPFPW